MKQKQMILDLGEILLQGDNDAVRRALIDNCTVKELEPVADALALAAPKPAKTQRSSAPQPNKANAPKHAEPTDPNKITVVVGPYGTESEAAQECGQFLRPNVFFYRSALFPLPQNFGVTVTVQIARPVKIVTPNPLYPYGAELHMTVTGAKAQGWIAAFKSRARFFNVAKT